LGKGRKMSEATREKPGRLGSLRGKRVEENGGAPPRENKHPRGREESYKKSITLGELKKILSIEAISEEKRRE